MPESTTTTTDTTAAPATGPLRDKLAELKANAAGAQFSMLIPGSVRDTLAGAVVLLEGAADIIDALRHDVDAQAAAVVELQAAVADLQAHAIPAA